MTKTVTIQAEPLTPEAYALFGNVVDPNRVQLYCDDGQFFVEKLTLGPRQGPLKRINRHYDAMQLFVPAERKPMLIVVAPSYMSAADFDATKIKAFVSDGTEAFTFHVGTWHIGPRSLDGTPLTLVNLQGQRSNEEHTEEIDLEELHDTVVDIRR